jgi:hypothetical protein
LSGNKKEAKNAYFLRLHPPIRRQRTPRIRLRPARRMTATKYDLLFALVLTTPILLRKAGLFILLALITLPAESFFLLR